jgi:hypothetical protein
MGKNIGSGLWRRESPLERGDTASMAVLLVDRVEEWCSCVGVGFVVGEEKAVEGSWLGGRT